MKRVFVILLLTAIVCISTVTHAENDFLQLSNDYIQSVADCSDKESFILSASGYDPAFCIISFDFTNGNQTIVAIDGDRCEVHAFFEDEELIGVLYQMITMFDEIEARLDEGKRLQYEMRFSEEEVYHITADTINRYFHVGET